MVRTANAALLPFRMPTLMFLSGLLLPKSLAKPLPAYYSGKLRMIAWPYFLWAALHLVLYGGKPMYDPEAWLATGYLWFLFYLLGYYLLAPLFRRLPSWVPLLLAIVGAFAFDHWLLHRFAYFGIFFFAGYVLSSQMPRIMAITRRPWAIAVIGYTAAGVAAYSATVGVQYVTLAAPFVIVGILGLAQLATLAAGRTWSRPLQFVGRTSIVYYVVHFPVMLLVARAMVGLGVTDWLPVAAATLTAALAVCTVLARYRHVVPVEYLFEAPRFRRRSRPCLRGPRFRPRAGEVGVTGGLDLRTVLLLLGAAALIAAWYVARRAPRLVVAAWAAVCFLAPIWVGVQAGIYLVGPDGRHGRRARGLGDVGLHVLVRRCARRGVRPAGARRVRRGRVDVGHCYRARRMAVPMHGDARCSRASTPAGCTRASPSRPPRRPCSASSSSPPASTRSSGSGCRMPPGTPGTSCSRGAASSSRGALAFDRLRGRLGDGLGLRAGGQVAAVGTTRLPLGDHHRGRDDLQPHRDDHAGDHLVLAVLLLGRLITRSMRVGVTVLLVVAVAVAAPLLGDVFTAAGEEAVGSAEYRSDLAILIGDMRALGITTSWTVLPTGETYYGSFQSIDSELVLTGLRFGALPLVVIVVAIITCVVGLLRGRATPAAVAVAAQVPAFATVALITQYGYLAWFLAGVAVTAYRIDRADSISPPSSERSILDGVPRERV